MIKYIPLSSESDERGFNISFVNVKISYRQIILKMIPRFRNLTDQRKTLKKHIFMNIDFGEVYEKS